VKEEPRQNAAGVGAKHHHALPKTEPLAGPNNRALPSAATFANQNNVVRAWLPASRSPPVLFLVRSFGAS
jgi:hypothetical protein